MLLEILRVETQLPSHFSIVRLLVQLSLLIEGGGIERDKAIVVFEHLLRHLRIQSEKGGHYFSRGVSRSVKLSVALLLFEQEKQHTETMEILNISERESHIRNIKSFYETPELRKWEGVECSRRKRKLPAQNP